MNYLDRPARSSAPAICSCEWKISNEFLIARLFPGRSVIRIEPGEDAHAIIARLPERMTHLIFQLNCTDTTHFIASRDALLRLLDERGVTVINGSITNISKLTLQRICLEHGLHSTLAPEHGDPDELLIVKTDMNAGGVIERGVLSPFDRQRLFISGDSPLLKTLLSRFKDYPVLTRRNIPAPWWRDSQLVIERFIKNDDDRFYRVHVLFDRVTITDAICHGPTKKLGRHVATKVTTCYTYRELDAGGGDKSFRALLHQVRAVQRHMKFDFAGIDIVVDNNGKPFVIDVNTTPFGGQTSADNPITSYLSHAIA